MVNIFMCVEYRVHSYQFFTNFFIFRLQVAIKQHLPIMISRIFLAFFIAVLVNWILDRTLKEWVWILNDKTNLYIHSKKISVQGRLFKALLVPVFWKLFLGNRRFLRHFFKEKRPEKVSNFYKSAKAKKSPMDAFSGHFTIKKRSMPKKIVQKTVTRGVPKKASLGRLFFVECIQLILAHFVFDVILILLKTHLYLTYFF